MKELLVVNFFSVVPLLNQKSTVALDFSTGAEIPFSFMSGWDMQSLNALIIGTQD